MAGVDQIVETIMSQAMDVASEITEAARENANKLTSLSETKILAEVEDINKNAMAKSWEVEQRTLTMADLERRRFYLSAKQEVIDTVFKEAMLKLKELSDDDYYSFISGLILQSVTTGSETVMYNKTDKRMPKAIEIANEKLGSKGKLTADDTADIDGGFILNESGVSTNCSYSMILRLKRDELQSAVAKKLFAEEE